MTNSVYHATMEYHGENMIFDKGGYYEKVTEDGTPVLNNIGREYFGFKHSNVEELAASKKPECAIFAVLKNYINETGDGSGLIDEITVNVYEINKKPDIDMCDAIAGDFALNKEVRFRNISEEPIKGELIHRVSLPGRVLGDVEMTYAPCGGGTNGVMEDWGLQVQESIKTYIETGVYPEDVSTVNGVDMPKLDIKT